MMKIKDKLKETAGCLHWSAALSRHFGSPPPSVFPACPAASCLGRKIQHIGV